MSARLTLQGGLGQLEDFANGNDDGYKSQDTVRLFKNPRQTVGKTITTPNGSRITIVEFLGWETQRGQNFAVIRAKVLGSPRCPDLVDQVRVFAVDGSGGLELLRDR